MARALVRATAKGMTVRVSPLNADSGASDGNVLLLSPPGVRSSPRSEYFVEHTPAIGRVSPYVLFRRVGSAPRRSRFHCLPGRAMEAPLTKVGSISVDFTYRCAGTDRMVRIRAEKSCFARASESHTYRLGSTGR